MYNYLKEINNLKNVKESKNINFYCSFLTSLLLLSYLSYKFINNLFLNESIKGIEIPIILVIMFTASILLAMEISSQYIIYSNLKHKQIKDKLLHYAVKEARLNNNYKPLNTIMKEFKELYILEIFYLINKHHQGTWLDKKELILSKKETGMDLPNDFHEKINKWFKSYKFEYEDLKTPFVIKMFLDQIFPERMQKLYDGIKDKDIKQEVYFLKAGINKWPNNIK